MRLTARILLAGTLSAFLCSNLLAQPEIYQKASGNSESGTKESVSPLPFKVKGHVGWKVRFAGSRPVATPAYANGQIFVGGGFGSHEFYALDATSGQLNWVYHTSDDGPTAAVYQDGCIAFNTESCELEILDPKGKRIWKSWLGDPLMSMPAIDSGRIFMAYPDSKGDHRHYLACFDLHTGKPLWKQPIAGELITSPVIADRKVYCTTLEGIVSCFGCVDGKELWSRKSQATSSPAVWRGKSFYSQRDVSQVKVNGKMVAQQNEQMAYASGANQDGVLSHTRATADYLDYQKRSSSSSERQKQQLDASVGFAGSKGDAKMAQASSNLGENSVYGVWSYQGSRPFLSKQRLFSSMGSAVKCVDVANGKLLWKRELGDPKSSRERPLTPPVTVHGKIFVGTDTGDLICMAEADGRELWRLPLGEPINFQPVVARGRIYVPTTSGWLFCLETGDSADDGWYMWGGTAAHNGL